jgi:hypothetical protein
MSDEHAAVSAREAAQAFTPLRGGRRGLEAAEHAIEQRVDELLLGGEVVVQGHRHGAEPGRDRAHRQRGEALRGDRFGGIEDDLAAQGAAGAPWDGPYRRAESAVIPPGVSYSSAGRPPFTRRSRAGRLRHGDAVG